MFILRFKKVFFTLAIVLVVGSLAGIIVKGFNWGIDFTGGSVVEIEYTTAVPSSAQVSATVKALLPDASVQQVGEKGFLIRTTVLTQAEKDELLKNITSTGEFTEKRFNTIGPSVGKELRTKSIISIILISIAITLFVAFAFRSISRPIASWKYGVIVITVLLHDIIIPAGFFAWSGIQVDTLFVVGILTILGVSVNDTIVVFDRIRENLTRFHGGKNALPFAEFYTKSADAVASHDTDARIVVLGRNETLEQVCEWLTVGAQNDYVIGFAVGRTVFLDAIKKYMSGEFTNTDAIKEIGENYFKLYQAFVNAKNTLS